MAFWSKYHCRPWKLVTNWITGKSNSRMTLMTTFVIHFLENQIQREPMTQMTVSVICAGKSYMNEFVTSGTRRMNK